MAYAIGYCLPIVGIILLTVWIIVNLKQEAELDAYMKKHAEECEQIRKKNR